MLIDEHTRRSLRTNGRGVAEHFRAGQEVDFHLGTFSKSLGGQGGFVAGSKELVATSWRSGARASSPATSRRC